LEALLDAVDVTSRLRGARRERPSATPGRAVSAADGRRGGGGERVGRRAGAHDGGKWICGLQELGAATASQGSTSQQADEKPAWFPRSAPIMTRHSGIACRTRLAGCATFSSSIRRLLFRSHKQHWTSGAQRHSTKLPCPRGCDHGQQCHERNSGRDRSRRVPRAAIGIAQQRAPPRRGAVASLVPSS